MGGLTSLNISSVTIINVKTTADLVVADAPPLSYVRPELSVLRIEPRASHMQDKRSTTEPHPQLQN
jgi:hypothetical protein